MLSNDDLLAAVDLTVDFHGNEASVEEHGMVLLDVNRNHLCVQHEADLSQTEWWPTAHCMFGLQACLDNDGSTTCDQAESGSEDDLAMTGGPSGRFFGEARHVARLVQGGPLHRSVFREAVGRDSIQRAVAVL